MNQPVPSSPPESAPEDAAPQPIAWALILIPAVAQLLLHLFTNGRFGIFRDEYYYLACASRPAWGYVDQPPLSLWVLGLWKGVFGDSVHSIRILPALCGSGLILLTGAVAAQLGGGRWAQLLASFAAGIGAAGLVICGFYSMNAYDLLFWTAAYYLLIRIARTGDGRLWLLLGLILGFGLLNKVGLLVFGAALVIGLVATKHRRQFTDKRLYVAGGIAVLFLLPYILWNAANDWPTLEFVRNATQYKISHMSPLVFLEENILEANPFTVPLWVGGLAWLFLARRARRFRLVGLMVVATWVILVVQKSKPYYFASSFPVLMAAGGVAWEQWTNGRWWRWARWVMVAVLIAGAAIFLPIAVPVLSPEGVAEYQERTGIAPVAQEVGHTSTLPQHFSDRLGWEELARTVSDVYTSLPPEDRKRCVVAGRNYGHAGSLEYWSKKYDLPPVVSSHNNYWLWGPPDPDRDVVIAIRGSRESWEELFEEVVEAGVSETPYALESHMTIWVCRKPRVPIASIWDQFKSFM